MKIEITQPKVGHPMIHKFITYVTHDPNLSKTVEDCANHLSLCPRQLRRICRNYLNASPSQVMRTILVEYAKRRLKESYYSIKTIAYELGFSNSSNFSNYFKNAVGMSPKSYRMKYQVLEMSEMNIFMSE